MPRALFGYTRAERRALFQEFEKLYATLKFHVERAQGPVDSLKDLPIRSREYHELVGQVHRELRQRWEITHEQLEAILQEGLKEDW